MPPEIVKALMWLTLVAIGAVAAIGVMAFIGFTLYDAWGAWRDRRGMESLASTGRDLTRNFRNLFPMHPAPARKLIIERGGYRPETPGPSSPPGVVIDADRIIDRAADAMLEYLRGEHTFMVESVAGEVFVQDDIDLPALARAALAAAVAELRAGLDAPALAALAAQLAASAPSAPSCGRPG